MHDFVEKELLLLKKEYEKMAKKLLITEKPSVAREFAKVLNINGENRNGYLESNEWVITWCVRAPSYNVISRKI